MIIYIDIDPVATNVQGVILSDFDQVFQDIVGGTVKQLLGIATTSLSDSLIFDACAQSLRTHFSRQLFESCSKTAGTLFCNSIDPEFIPLNLFVTVESSSSLYHCLSEVIFSRNRNDNNYKRSFQVLTPPFCVFDLDVNFIDGTVVPRNVLSFDPNVTFNIFSVVYELTSIIYVAHNGDYKGIFSNDGRNYTFCSKSPQSCLHARGFGKHFTCKLEQSGLSYFPTLLFYQQKPRIRKV